MTDYFFILGQPRRPWLDLEELKRSYLTLSAKVHPDRCHGAPEEQQEAATAHHAELNAAYQRLREPKDRLLHLIELELGRKPEEIQNVPAETMELFIEIGKLCRGADAFLTGRERVSSSLLKARMFEEALDWTDRLQQMQHALAGKRAVLEDRLKGIDAAWNAAPDSGQVAPFGLPWPELEQLYRQFSFLGRWIGQLQERIVQLSL